MTIAEIGDTDPIELLLNLGAAGWEWSIDRTNASPEEALMWTHADLIARAVRALATGRAVRIMGRRWLIESRETSAEVIHGLEEAINDAIKRPRQMLGVLQDDPDGDLLIGVIDLAAKIRAALDEGRAVRFRDEVWTNAGLDSEQVAGEILEAINRSGLVVRAADDDPSGDLTLVGVPRNSER